MNMPKPKFHTDIKQNEILEPFIKDVFGNFIVKAKGGRIIFYPFGEYTEEQFDGKDFAWTDGIRQIMFDIKCQVDSYINNPTPTFCIELWSKNKYGEYVIGWYLKDDSKTDYYLFVWFHDADLPEDRPNFINTPSEINKMELALVKKTDVAEYLNKFGITNEILLDRAQKLAKSGKKVDYIETPKKNFKLTRSSNKSEAPVNLILSKYVYNTMPHTHWYIYEKDKGVYPTNGPIFKEE